MPLFVGLGHFTSSISLGGQIWMKKGTNPCRRRSES